MNAPDSLPDITLELIDLDRIFDLRKAVLRPWLTPEGSRAAYADGAERFHVGAIQNGSIQGGALQNGRVVSTVSFKIELPAAGKGAALSQQAPGQTRWRLLSMATYPEFQGRGLGGRVLGFAIDELARRLAVRDEAAAVLWCEGRTSAQRFYEGHGFQAIGDVFENPGTGPHYVFWRSVAAA